MSHGRIVGVAAGLTVLMLGMSGGVFFLWLRDHSVVNENHLVEWSQVVFLLLAAIVHAGKSSPGHWRGESVLRWGLALLCVSMAVREVDIDRLGDAEIMPMVELVVRGIVIAAWMILAWFALHRFGAIWARRWSLAWSGAALLTMGGCLLYGSSWPFDKYPEMVGAPVARLIEETLQLNATFLLMAAAWMPLYTSQMPTATRDVDEP